MTRIAVLGVGRVGSLVARDLADEHEVTAFDASAEALSALRNGSGIETTVQRDLADPEVIARTVADFDLVVGALPGRLGFRALEAVVGAGVNVVDITFMPEDPRSLHEEARRRGVTAVVDCGVAPGISNLLVGRAAERLRPVDTVRILVGGLPRVRRRPYEYKAGFSPEDVLEEYTRPARLMEEGHVVTRPPLTEIETLDWPGVGTVEAFLTDGLRSLLDTVSARAMVEKTIRYPGHADLMRVLAESGFFGREALTLADGTRVRPRDLTARLLFPLWTYEEGEEDLTLMRIEVVGGPAGARRRLVHDLTDTYDAATRSTSMARTTAYPCTAVARRIARGDLREPGVVPPERLGPREGFWEDLAGDLAARGVSVSEREEPA